MRLSSKNHQRKMNSKIYEKLLRELALLDETRKIYLVRFFQDLASQCIILEDVSQNLAKISGCCRVLSANEFQLKMLQDSCRKCIVFKIYSKQ